MHVLDEKGSGLKFLAVRPRVPTACAGSHPQVVTGVFFRMCGYDSDQIKSNQKTFLLSIIV